jgi:hypothetical protein
VEPDELAVFQRSHPVAVCGVHAQRSPELAAEVTADAVGDLVDLDRAGRVVQRRPIGCSPA